MGLVRFIRGGKSAWDVLAEKDSDSLYFILDENTGKYSLFYGDNVIGSFDLHDLGYSDFDPSSHYAERNAVIHNGKLYRFTTSHDGEWDEDDVRETNVAELIRLNGGGGGGGVTQEEFEDHTGNTYVHTTSAEKTAWNDKYSKPASGIPKSDLASSVQTSLGKADSAYAKPSGGIPKSDLASSVQTSLGKADSAYAKPSGGIPKSDLASSVQTSLGKADSALQSHQSIKTINGEVATGTGNISVGTVKSVGITAGSGISASVDSITESGNITIGLSTEITGQAMITSLSNVPISNRYVFAEISSNQVLSFASLPEAGQEIHVIIHNGSNSNVINITLPNGGGYVCTSFDTIYIAGDKYGEVNLIRIGDNAYVRGVSSV